MEIRLSEVEMDGNSPVVINFSEDLLTQKGGWTAEELGLELDEEKQITFTKQDFEKALKKVSRKVKK